jgi:acyl-CoA hydrolase
LSGHIQLVAPARTAVKDDSVAERVAAGEAVERLATALGGAGRVFVPGCAAEPLTSADAFRAAPQAAAGLTFVGVWIPGVNRTDWAGLHPTARAESIFVSPDWRASFEAGRFEFRPLTYAQAWRWLQTTPLDAGLFQVSPPDAGGLCSLGVTADFAPAVLGRPMLKIAEVNARMPPVENAPRVPLDAFDFVVDVDLEPVGYDPGPADEATLRIARRVLERVPDGATVQLGLGKVGAAVLAALRERRGLAVHSGMVTEPLVELLSERRVDSVTTGTALGSERLRRACADPCAPVRFRPVGYTHDPRVLAAIPRLVAVNSALQVDLFGQANAEFAGGRQVSGGGGLLDFLRGARASDGGVPVLALNATAKGGTVSRIVPRLSDGAVSVGRADAGLVVTEHGLADLRELDLDARAEALISVAAPEHRDDLAAAWAALRRRM